MDDTLYDVIIVGAGISGRDSAKIQMITPPPQKKSKTSYLPLCRQPFCHVMRTTLYSYSEHNSPRNENLHQLICEFLAFALCQGPKTWA